MQASDLASELLGLWDFGNAHRSEDRFRTLLERVSGDPEAEAVVQTQIARAQGLQRRFDEAHVTLDGVEGSPAARGARVAVRLALERGRLFNSARDFVCERFFAEPTLIGSRSAGRGDWTASFPCDRAVAALRMSGSQRRCCSRIESVWPRRMRRRTAGNVTIGPLAAGMRFGLCHIRSTNSL